MDVYNVSLYSVFHVLSIVTDVSFDVWYVSFVFT